MIYLLLTSYYVTCSSSSTSHAHHSEKFIIFIEKIVRVHLTWYVGIRAKHSAHLLTICYTLSKLAHLKCTLLPHHNDGCFHTVKAVYCTYFIQEQGRALWVVTATTLEMLTESAYISETSLREVVDVNAI